MKRWAVLTVAIYVAMLVLLTVPVVYLTFGDGIWGENNGVALKEILTGFKDWSYWAWLVVMAAGQALLLFAPIKVKQRRLTPKRPLLVPVLTTGFFLAVLLFTGGLSLLCLLFKDKAFEIFNVTGQLAVRDIQERPYLKFLFRGPIAGIAGADYLLGMIAIMALCWVAWALVFYLFARADKTPTLVQRSTRWLLRGSVLELLVAVPSHIIVRNRNDCCAPIGTFWGITMGISVMLICFGPGVFFLFAERFGRLKPGDRDPLPDKEIAL